jgi:hypothetical protein
MTPNPKDIEEAFIDFVDAFEYKWYDIKYSTGWSEERCKEVVKLAEDLKARVKP